VTVGVGLDHRLDPDTGAGRRPEDGEIAAQRGKVELEPCQPGQGWQPGAGEADLDRFGGSA